MKHTDPIEVTHSYLIDEWFDRRKPSEFTAGSHYRAAWKCASYGHIWETQIKNRVNGSNCPHCSKRRVKTGINDISTTHPEIALEWNDKRSPKEFSSGSGYEAGWKCFQGHVYFMQVSSRIKSKEGCPHCSGARVLSGFNDLATTHPYLIAEWDDKKDISTVTRGSQYRAKWKCKTCNEKWITEVSSRTHPERLQGCPYCSKRKSTKGVNDLLTTHPHLSKEWYDERKIETVSAGSSYKAQWKCNKGHSYKRSIYSRTSYKYGCQYCSGRKVLKGFNDLTTTHPHLINEWNDKNDISTFTKGSEYRATWKCSKEGHIWKTPVYYRTGKDRTGCPHCASSAPETEVYEFVSSNFPDLKIERNTRKVISPYELDIYIKEINKAIEFNGTYWHSDEFIQKTRGISADDYHQMKETMCAKTGTSLLYVSEENWKNNNMQCRQDILKFMAIHTGWMVIEV